MKKPYSTVVFLLTSLVSGAMPLKSFGEVVPHVIATASSGLYWEVDDTSETGKRVVVDRRAGHAVDGSGLRVDDEVHCASEGTTWESVGNGWTSQVGIPGGDDPLPWIQFTFPQPYSISSFDFWNFGDPARSVYRAGLIADETNLLGGFTFSTNAAAGCSFKQTFQLHPPVTASSIRFVITENGGGVTFPASTNGFTTLVGIGEVRFNITPPPVVLSAVVASGSEVSISWASQVSYTYQLQSTADLSSSDWQDEGAAIPGTGGVLSIVLGMQPGTRFFQVKSIPVP